MAAAKKKASAIDRREQVRKIMEYYRKYGPPWSSTRRRFSERKANEFFVGVMLDQGQDADRAWDAGKYMVENYFSGTEDFWCGVAKTHHSTIGKICRTGYLGKAFALGVKVNVFPKNLKAAANKIVDEYGSDVRNIWNNIGKKDVDKIYFRFKEFDGIGDALAKMAQFILVRSYGIAGGKESKKYMSVKPDIHLQRVLFRLGIAERQTAASVASGADRLKLSSPADFDWAVWDIGRSYCHSNAPDCSNCPLDEVCESHHLP